MSKIDIEQLAKEAYPLKEGYNSFEYSIAFKNRAAFIKGYQKATEAQKQPAMSLEECKQEVAKKYGYNSWAVMFVSNLKHDLSAHQDEVAILYANQFREAQKCDPSVFRICSSCNTEFELTLTKGMTERCSAFPNCTHCGARNDVWISVRTKPLNLK